MDLGRKIFLFLGVIFTAIGLLTIIPSVLIAIITGSIFGAGIGIGLLIPAFIGGIFLIIGVPFMSFAGASYIKEKKARENGKRYAAKIYSYVEDKSMIVNDDYLMNAVVHYFDDTGVEVEGVIPTKFPKGDGSFPIGMTIDIFEYNGDYSFDKNSVRAEKLEREDELMDDKPIDRADVKLIAITCSNCGASFEAVKGYTARCPYCSSVTNA